MPPKGGNKTPVAPGSVPFQTVIAKQFVYAQSPQGGEVVATAFNQQRIFNANAGYEDHPDSLKQFPATVLALSTDGKSALVNCKGDTTNIWVPLEIAGVIVGDRVRVDFRDEGGVAVVLIVQ